MAFNVVDRRCKFSTNVKYALSSFFFRLQEMGVYSFESITEDAVLEVFSKDEKQKMGHSLKYSVEYGLKACLPYYGKSVERIIAYLPAIEHSIPYRARTDGHQAYLGARRHNIPAGQSHHNLGHVHGIAWV